MNLIVKVNKPVKEKNSTEKEFQLRNHKLTIGAEIKHVDSIGKNY